jgi:hypothetical protein
MRVLCVACALFLTGCADVTVTQVDDTGQHRKDAVPGFYVPRLMPYLLVADLPPDPAPPKAKPPTPKPKPKPKPKPGHKAPHTDAVAKPDPATGDDPSPADGGSPPTASASASASDQSFLAVTKSYVIKLVYLPDYSHQQAIRASSGLFGKATLNLALTDGALTSLQANMDSTENGEVFKSALTALVTAATGGAAGVPAVATSATTRDQQLVETAQPRTAQPLPPLHDSLLHPGLYRLVYDHSGEFSGLTKVTGFCARTGLTMPDKLDVCSEKVP